MMFCLCLTLGVAACRPVEEKAGPPGGEAYVAPPVEPRRNPTPSPDIHRWLEASASVRTQLAGLQQELASLQQFHVENHFDNFLALDPDTLDPAQLTYLQHFLERGYFRIEREILLQLLESRQARAAADSRPTTGDAPDIATRLQAAIQRDETMIIDLEAAIARYRAPGDDPIQVPVILTEEQLATLRQKVAAQVKTERLKIGELDGKISALKARL